MTGHDDESLETPPPWAGAVPAPGDGVAGAVPGEDAPVQAAAGDEPPKSGFRLRHAVLVFVLVVAVAAIVSSLVSVPYYAITPGVAQPVSKLIGVPKAEDHTHTGQILLVDVELTPLKAIEWLWYKLDPNADIIPNSALLGPETATQYNTEGVLDMSDAQQAATVVALQQLGYHVSVRGTGALVYALLPGSPAEAALSVGDRISAVDGHTVGSATALVERLRSFRAGDVVHFGVVTYPSHKLQTVDVRLSAWRIKGKGAAATLVCPPYGTGSRYPIDHQSFTEAGKTVSETPCIGVLQLESAYAVSKLPFTLNLSNENIIGPSAGLAFTLGIMQRLDPYNLTGGHTVAATGTMSITGQIGDVGGVAQKTIAVRNAGAKIFFVPPPEYKVAEAHSGGQLKIYSVSNIGQVVKILETLGGRVPAPKG